MANQATGLWVDERRVERLKTLFDEAYPCSIIAAALTAEFKSHFTRNAVIGKASRLGLVSKNQPGFVKREKKERKPRPVGTAKRIVGNRAERVTIYEERLRLADVVPLHIGLLELGPTSCRYTYGDGPFTFCGCEALPGLSYCEPHDRLAHLDRRMTPLEYSQHKRAYREKMIAEAA